MDKPTREQIKKHAKQWAKEVVAISPSKFKRYKSILYQGRIECLTKIFKEKGILLEVKNGN